MGVKHFNLPDPGEGLVEAEIVTWKVKPGDTVKTNDIVVEIETAKSLVELPIPWDGKVVELLVAEGTTAEVGQPIVSVEVAGVGDDPAPAASGAGAGEAAEPEGGEERVANLVGYGPAASSGSRRRRKGSAPAAGGGRALAKPPVRKYAKDIGVDLSLVTPSSDRGIISRADVDEFVARGGAGASGAEATGSVGAASDATAVPAYTPPVFSRSGEREVRTPIKGVRKVTAQAMVGSAFSAPHVTEFITVDVSRTMDLVARLGADREFRDVKVSPLLIVAKALCLAVRRNPGINATWDDAAGEIVQKNYVNLGIAAATPRGLIVPNIKDADQMTLRQLADAMADLVSTARAGRTQPAAQSGGTITITNVGVFGVDNGTPIINPGESAILCFGAVRKMPWVVTAADGTDEIVPRWVTQLSVAFDHRLVDGDLGSRFLADVAAVLEDPSRALVWG